MTEQETGSQAPAPRPRWMRGALVHGFCTCAQSYYAANLALFHLVRRGSYDRLGQKIALWEQRLAGSDIKPKNPGRLKSLTSFLLETTALVGPVMAAGFAAGFLLGPMGGFIVAALLNTHCTLGEALLQTARSKGVNLMHPKALTTALAEKDFAKTARSNVLIKGGIAIAFTVLAGPIARLMGGFTGNLLRGLARTPLGALVTEQALRSTQTSLLESAYKGLGKVFANAATANGKGVQTLLNSAPLLFVRSAVRLAFDRAAALFPPKEQPEQQPLSQETLEIPPAERPPEKTGGPSQGMQP